MALPGRQRDPRNGDAPPPVSRDGLPEQNPPYQTQGSLLSALKVREWC